jgi:hypothetical protein
VNSPLARLRDGNRPISEGMERPSVKAALRPQ